MERQRTFLISFFILVLAILAGIYASPKKLDFFNFPYKEYKLGLDLQGGIRFLYQADLSDIPQKERKSVMMGLKEVMERRVNLFGVREPQIKVQGERLIIELPGVLSPEEARKEIGKTPFLEFREEREKEEVEKNLEKIKEEVKKRVSKEEWEKLKELPAVLLLEKAKKLGISFEDPFFKKTPLTGRYLKRAEVDFDPETYNPVVSLEFNEEGAKIFEELTERNVGKQLAIFIDGDLISSPVVREKISGGRAQITGKFSVREAKELASNLNAGALPVPITLLSQDVIGATLGRNSLEKSLKAGIYGFLAILIFMILFYRFPGLISSLALIIYVVLVLTIFKILSVTLTLAGIGGFILSIGMAIDANILIFSRMREELRAKKDFPQALKEGFKRAWPAIRDGNFTTLAVSIILFTFGSSFVKGFATTLSLGILSSLFSALIVTKYFLKCFEGSFLEKVRWLWS